MIHDLTVDDIVDRENADELGVPLADASLQLMKQVFMKDKNDLPKLYFAVLEMTDNIAKDKDEIVLQLVAHSFTRMPDGRSFPVVFEREKKLPERKPVGLLGKTIGAGRRYN